MLMVNANNRLAMSDNVPRFGKLIWHKAVRAGQAMNQIQILECNLF